MNFTRYRVLTQIFSCSKKNVELGRNELHSLQGIDTLIEDLDLDTCATGRNELHSLQGIDTHALCQVLLDQIQW